jgi:hypothetical protein
MRKLKSGSASSTITPRVIEYLPHQAPQTHPDLEVLYLIDCISNTRINPNVAPISVENEFCKGKLLVMVRTCDADQKVPPIDSGGTTSNDAVSNYLRPKKRRFEIQFQIKFKKIPSSQMFLSLEYDQVAQMGLLARGAFGGLMKFTKMKNSDFSYSLSGSTGVDESDIQQGKYEIPHFSFPIEKSLDVIVVTKDGDKPPTLGKSVDENLTAKKRRQKGVPIEYNTKDTYTFCLWNANIDMIQWKTMGIPAVPKFSLSHLNSGQPFAVHVYGLKSTPPSGQHLQCEMEDILRVEINNGDATKMGKSARKWIENCMNESDEDSISVSSYYTTATRPGDDFADEVDSVSSMKKSKRNLRRPQKNCCNIC